MARLPARFPNGSAVEPFLTGALPTGPLVGGAPTLQNLTGL
jgi:hypothetical protein